MSIDHLLSMAAPELEKIEKLARSQITVFNIFCYLSSLTPGMVRTSL